MHNTLLLFFIIIIRDDGYVKNVVSGLSLQGLYAAFGGNKLVKSAR